MDIWEGPEGIRLEVGEKCKSWYGCGMNLGHCSYGFRKGNVLDLSKTPCDNPTNGDIYRPMTVQEVEDIVLTGELYEGHSSLVNTKCFPIEKIISIYMNIKSNPMTELTYKGQRVRVK